MLYCVMDDDMEERGREKLIYLQIWRHVEACDPRSRERVLTTRREEVKEEVEDEKE